MGRKLISCCMCIIAGSAAATMLSLNAKELQELGVEGTLGRGNTRKVKGAIEATGC
ncbi:hypothetical protein L195_g018270 [Trifolium pratense]|uniref:Uncharacterized protein n=1 Tax=Trifolium pratense TaxID=57577 RepID=A0A2K3MWA0_TRIPR|nr:hypothetical protein L195_g018270 [Trifolium pratense]